MDIGQGYCTIFYFDRMHYNKPWGWGRGCDRTSLKNQSKVYRRKESDIWKVAIILYLRANAGGKSYKKEEKSLKSNLEIITFPLTAHIGN